MQKYFVIRGFHAGDRLQYDSSGKLLKGGAPEPWTLAGLQITSLDLHGGRLDINGKRTAYMYEPSKQKFVSAFRVLRTRAGMEVEKVRIETQVGAPVDDSAVRQLLNKILIPAEANLADVAPEYWHDFLSRRELPEEKAEPGSIIGKLPDGELVFRPGKEIKLPQPIWTPDPSYTEPARMARLQGTALLRMTVDASGKPRDIRVLRPLGFGLDDMAVDAVREWKYTPAQRNAQPVAVRMNVEVQFRLF